VTRRVSPFSPLETFMPESPGYRLLPFRFMRWPGGEVLLVNDVGEHQFLNADAFDDFVGGRLERDHPSYRDLKSKHLLIDTASDAPIELLATKLRTKKSFLAGFTRLHLFVVTLRCDHSCRYCQVSRVTANRARFDMSAETAHRAVDLMFSGPAPGLKVEFQGGEPLLAFDRIRDVVELVEERARREGREVELVVATSLSPLTDEMLDFFADHSVLISTSLDGPAWLHNANRPHPSRDAHGLVERNIARVRAALGQDRVSAIMTTTARALAHPCEIVDEYVRLGFDSIFLRPISPYGFAVRTGEDLLYESEQFFDFYRRALDRVIEINRRGYELVEVYSQILLTKMLTPFATGYVDLQSPSGAGIGAVAYNYDGDVYASDESRMLAEMGDKTFRLGNVHQHGYPEIFGGPVLRSLVAGSIHETMPGCAECAFAPFCGTDPVFHHRTQGDPVGHRPSSAFCHRNMALLRHLFTLLRQGEPFVRELLTSWATLAPTGTEAAA